MYLPISYHQMNGSEHKIDQYVRKKGGAAI